MNRLESMQVFVAAVDAGSLSGAGRALGMPLPTVSRKISELEAHVKAQLLSRSTRRLALTDAGRAYLDACRRILTDINEAERLAAGEYSAPRGELVMTAPLVFGRLHVLPVVADFLRAYPDVTVRLLLGDRAVNLLEDNIDVALRVGELADSGLFATRLGEIRRVVCASPAYLRARGVPRAPKELAQHSVVSFELFASSNGLRFASDGKTTQVAVHPRLTVSTAEAAIDAAIAGVGLTCVFSYQIEAALRAQQLSVVLREFEPAPVPVSLLYSAMGRLPLKLRALLDFATPRLRDRLERATHVLEQPRKKARKSKEA